MSACDMVKTFLDQLEAHDVPQEYISAAVYLDDAGNKTVLTGDKLTRLLQNHPDYHYIKEVRILINLNKVVQDINLEVDYIYEQVDRLFAEEEIRKL